jgi:hypothetical protein
MPESEIPLLDVISSILGGLFGKRGENFVFLFFAMLPPS